MLTERAKTAVRWLLPGPVYRLYRQRRTARRVATYRPRQVTHTYGGLPLTVEIADGLAEAWYDHDWPPLPELERLRDHGLGPGARIFDLGAHQGIVALMLADAVGASGSVLAVEAEPHNARAAERNRRLNGVGNLEVLHAAGAAATGSVLFAEGLNGHVEDTGSRLGKVAVPAITVDDLAARYGAPDVVMIDVEGFEGQVLAGARETIDAGRTAFLIEVHVGHGLDRDPGEILAAFGPPYLLLLAPADREEDAFQPYDGQTTVLQDRFFLIAAPS